MGGVELKTVNPVVHDDKRYCRSFTYKCDFLSGSNPKCALFDKIPLKYKPFEFMAGVFSSLYKRPLKCQECKDHYLKNKTQ